MDRRGFIKTVSAAAAGLAVSSVSLAGMDRLFRTAPKQEEIQYDFLMARVRFDCDRRVSEVWRSYPGAEYNLLSEFSSVVRSKVKLPQNCRNDQPLYGREDQFNAVVSFDDLETFRKYPFALMTSEGSYSFSQNQKENLKNYLRGGGFLLMDDCVYTDNRGGDFFYQSSYKLLEEIFGQGSVVRIPKTHEVFHNVFDFGDEGMPYMQGQNYGAHGLFIDNRLAVFLSPSDLHCGWTNPQWFGQKKYKSALEMGINIIMYAISH
jgi:hypothetical protein